MAAVQKLKIGPFIYELEAPEDTPHWQQRRCQANTADGTRCERRAHYFLDLPAAVPDKSVRDFIRVRLGLAGKAGQCCWACEQHTKMLIYRLAIHGGFIGYKKLFALTAKAVPGLREEYEVQKLSEYEKLVTSPSTSDLSKMAVKSFGASATKYVLSTIKSVIAPATT